MSKSIRLSPAHGVNPTIPICFWCGNEKNEIALMGKLPSAVMRVAQAAGVPTLLVAGRVRNADVLHAAGFTHVQCINDPDTPLSVAMRPDYAAARLTHTTADTLSVHNIG